MRMVRFATAAIDLDQVVSIKGAEPSSDPDLGDQVVVQFRGCAEQRFEGSAAQALAQFIRALPDGVALAGRLGAQAQAEARPGQGDAAEGE